MAIPIDTAALTIEVERTPSRTDKERRLLEIVHETRAVGGGGIFVYCANDRRAAALRARLRARGVIVGTSGSAVGVRDPSAVVVHWDLPDSVEIYAREIAGARRAVLLYRSAREQSAEMRRYARSAECRMRLLREHFGDEAGAPCGRCDSCRRVREPRFLVGERVRHRRYGSGQVIAVEGRTVTVAFARDGERRVLDAYLFFDEPHAPSPHPHAAV